MPTTEKFLENRVSCRKRHAVAAAEADASQTTESFAESVRNHYRSQGRHKRHTSDAYLRQHQVKEMKNYGSNENSNKKGACDCERTGFSFHETRNPFRGRQTKQQYRKNECQGNGRRNMQGA